jgi:hypothetical protein
MSIEELYIATLKVTRAKILAELSEVEGRLSGTLRTSTCRAGLLERKNLLLRNLREENLRIKRENMASPITDHALVRWLERKHGLDSDRLRDAILTDALREAMDGTDQRLGVSFDQQDGSAVGGWTEYDVIGAYAHTARHAVKCAEWCRTQDVAWRSSPRTGRAGFRLQ